LGRTAAPFSGPEHVDRFGLDLQIAGHAWASTGVVVAHIDHRRVVVTLFTTIGSAESGVDHPAELFHLGSARRGRHVLAPAAHGPTSVRRVARTSSSSIGGDDGTLRSHASRDGLTPSTLRCVTMPSWRRDDRLSRLVWRELTAPAPERPASLSRSTCAAA